MPHPRHLLAPLLPLALVLGTTLDAAEWHYRWTAASRAPAAGPQATVCTFRYGKRWAYSLELDDGPKWNLDFGVPFLAGYRYTDAPPGITGGQLRPFVGGVAPIAGSIGANGSLLDWQDLAALQAAGWGVINHSFAHSGRSWGDASGQMSDVQIREDGFWSQALFAHHLGRAPNAVVYANGYTDYNRGGALSALGIQVGTRVGGSGSSVDVTRADIAWMDLSRTYLDEGAWTNQHQHGDPMVGIPKDVGPAAGQWLIDFTHGIDQDPESANHLRWRTRLGTIADTWGATGADSVWCAPSGEVAAYLHAARAAVVTVAAGELSVSLPDGQPGSALTVELRDLDPADVLTPPPGGVLYREGNRAWITTPTIGEAGLPAPMAGLHLAYTGPPGAITFERSTSVAAVMVRCHGKPGAERRYQVTLRTPEGERHIGERTFGDGWTSGTTLHALLPDHEAVVATGGTVTAIAPINQVQVWGVGD